MKIKVRVWDGEQYVSPDYIDRNGVAHWTAYSIPISSSETELFTGLLDRNGKEVYEGDLVKQDLSHPKYILGDKPARPYDCGHIEFFLGFMVCQSGIGATPIDDFCLCHCCPCALEVIGNIHEGVKTK